MRIAHQHNPRPARLRLFAEHVPAAALRAPALLAALRERGVQLVFSALPDEDPLPTIVAAREHDVDTALWPMLDNRDGRWANSANAPRFVDFTRRLLARLDAADARPHELCLDLEPPLSTLRRATHGRPVAPPPGDREAATAALATLVREAAALGIASWAAAVPLVLADPHDRPTWQRLLGTPIDPLPLQRVSVMLYSSLALGYGRGLLRTRDVDTLVYQGACLARQRFGPRAAVALGAIGRGALGDEAGFRDPAALARDVALVRAAGIDDLALFDLGGALRRPPLQHWLDALLEPARAPADRGSRRARLLWFTFAAIARAGRSTPPRPRADAGAVQSRPSGSSSKSSTSGA
ncbi:MAG: hypothetical protein K1X88_34370 [Nannocystaceae bacterium]|nr:hypothetical protein [Nannocystaceae bacterium]